MEHVYELVEDPRSRDWMNDPENWGLPLPPDWMYDPKYYLRDYPSLLVEMRAKQVEKLVGDFEKLTLRK